MTIRDAQPGDASELLSLMAQIDSETNFMLFEAGERSLDVARQEKILETVEKSPEITLLVAEEDGQLVGYLGMTQLKERRVHHIATLVCGVAREAWGRGVGKALMRSALERARESGISRVELTVVAGNHRARKLYEKAGFVVEGYRKQAMLIDGAFEDECYMALILPGDPE